MNDEIMVLESIKQEMTAAWAYLHAYTELFGHSDKKRRQLLEETAPGFFALVQTAFIENALARLARLMDPEKSSRQENLSFKRLCCPCSGVAGSEPFLEQFTEVCRSWNSDGGKYHSLKEHRNKVHAHNDFPTIKKAPHFVTTKLTLADVQLIKELFCDLWRVLATAHYLLKDTALTEPFYGHSTPQPKAIFPYLSSGLYMEKSMLLHLDLFGDFLQSEFAEVGRDGITRLLCCHRHRSQLFSDRDDLRVTMR